MNANEPHLVKLGSLPGLGPTTLGFDVGDGYARLRRERGEREREEKIRESGVE